MDNIVIDVFLFYAIPVFMGVTTISLANPKGDNRNSSAGYRTKRSMQSPENWNIANKTFGYFSFVILIMEIISHIIEYKFLVPENLLQKEQLFYINVIVLFVGIALSLFITEFRLRRKK